MPSFTKECLEKWRDERISNTEISDYVYSNPKALKNAISVTEDDLKEEKRRLREAQIHLDFCKMNIDSLESKLKKLIEIANSQKFNKDSIETKTC